MMKLEWKNKRFLKSFITIALILFVIMAIVLFSVYNLFLGALEREVEELNWDDAHDYLDRLETALGQCNRLASSIVSDSTVRFFFTAETPTVFYSDYYSRLQGKINAYGFSYVDSVILYAPRFDRVYNPSFATTPRTVDQLRASTESADLGWLPLLGDAEYTETTLHVRAKDNRWPYYLSLIKHYRTGSVEGVAIINIDLRKLYNDALVPYHSDVQLYGVDTEGGVFIRDGKQELILPVYQVEQLAHYQSGKELSLVDRDANIAYAQAYSEEYGYTMVTVSRLDEYRESIMWIQIRCIFWGVVALVVVIVLALMYSVRLVRPIHTIQRVLKSPMDWKDDKMRHSKEVREIADEIVQSLQFNAQLQDELTQRLELLSRTQMLALQAQINPHFLFNTLNMICLMIERDCGDEYLGGQMIRSLSDILRYSLADRKLTTLREEMEYVEKYLSILRQRYKNFEYTLDAEEGLEDCLIPKLVLQPLLENAIQHGISGCLPTHKGALWLTIRECSFTYKSEKTLPSVSIELVDNGTGISAQRLEEVHRSIHDYSDISTDHIGLANVAQRFYLCFQEEQDFHLESELGKGTFIRICFPKIKNPKELEER